MAPAGVHGRSAPVILGAIGFPTIVRQPHLEYLLWRIAMRAQRPIRRSISGAHFASGWRDRSRARGVLILATIPCGDGVCAG